MENTNRVTIGRPAQRLALTWPINGPDKQIIRIAWSETSVGSGTVRVNAPAAETIFGGAGLRGVLEGAGWEFENNTVAHRTSMTNAEAYDIAVAVRAAWFKKVGGEVVAAS